MRIPFDHSIRHAFSLAVLVGIASSAGAAVLVSYDASSGLAPDGVVPAWQKFGSPMNVSGGVLHQDNTADDPVTESGEYLSPSAGAG